MMPRPQRRRTAEGAAADPRARTRRSAAAHRRPAAGRRQSNADQNLAEMAQRLEAALRRPAGAPSRRPCARAAAGAPGAQRDPRGGTAPQKSGFENLEDEMASLLGRPKNSS